MATSELEDLKKSTDQLHDITKRAIEALEVGLKRDQDIVATVQKVLSLVETLKVELDELKSRVGVLEERNVHR
jgi:F420-0:gamma-glutamyl ligase